MLRLVPSPDHIAAARAFVGNPASFAHLDPAEWADLQATSWRVLRQSRPAAPPPQGCTVTIIPRAVFQAHARPAPHLRHRSHTPGDAA